MDVLEYIKKMQEMYGDDVITTADKLEKPPKTVVREIFEDFNARNPKADGGQLVAPSVDGSRPGYDGKKNITTEIFKNEYEKFQKFKKNKGTDLEFAEYLNKNYKTPKGLDFNTKNVQTFRVRKKIKTPIISGTSPTKMEKYKKITTEIEKLVNEANAGEKHIRILDIAKKIEKKFKIKIPQGKLDTRIYPSLLNLDSRADKIDNVLKNMLIDDKPLKSHWYDAIQNRTGISQDTISDHLKKSQTYNVIKDEGANYLKYLSGKEIGVDLKNMSFSDQLKYASEMQAGRPTYTDMGGNKRYSAKPRNKVMEFALRNWNQNKGKGPIKFFDKNGKLISWEFGKKLPYSKVSFSYGGKKHKFNNMDMNYLKTNFPEVYEKQTSLNRLAIKEVDDPFKKGSKILVKDLIKKIQVDGYQWSPRLTTLDIMHGKKGVAGEPFTNLTYASRDLNQLESGINSSLRAGNITKTQANDAIKFIRKDIQGLTGDVLDTAIINRQLSLAKDIKAGKITDYDSMKKNFLKNLENKKFGRVADVVVKASKDGGFGEAVQQICMRKKAKKGGRMFLSNGSGCPAADQDPKGFLKSVSDNPQLAKFLKSSPGKKAMTLAARVSGNVLNPSTLIGGEVAFVLGDGLNNFASGLPLDESFDRAFVFADFGQFEKNLINQAKELGYDDNQLNLLQQTININKLDNRKRKLEYGLEVGKQDPSALTSDATMGFENRLVDTNKNLGDSVINYLGTLDKMGFDSNKAADQDTGFTYLDNVFKKRTQDQLVKDFEDRKRQVDPTQTPVGDFLSPVFDLGSYTQPLKFAADIVNPFTKDVPFLSERQREAKRLKEMDPRELYLYNKQRGFTLDDIQQGTSPQIRPLMDYLGTDVTGQGFGTQFLAGGGIANLTNTIPPKSGPMSQGLRSLYNNGRKL